jgi:hypothetical protein
MRLWKEGPNGPEEFIVQGHPLVAWVHDESIFYANDRRTVRWVHKNKKATPQAKGEDASLMVVDFVSADYGWLCSPDGKESAQVLFKPGKTCNGYFDHEDILKQANRAMDILTQYYPDEDHLLIYDNATTHLKHAGDALSAHRMPKGIPKDGKNWGVLTTVVGPDGKVLKKVIRMADGEFDGKPQSLYFHEGHEYAGIFKRMRQILQEWGLMKEAELRAEC